MNAENESALEQVRVGVVGLGHWGPHYVRVFSLLPDSRVPLCCDTDEKRTAEIKRLFPLVEVTNDPGELLGSELVDCVVIATPATTHSEVAVRALEAGKDVLVEKPLALTTSDAKRVCETAARAGRLLMVGHTFIYNPGIMRMREFVSSGEVGRVYYMLATRTHLGLIRDDVDVLWDLAPHDVSICSYVLGARPVGASAIGRSFLREDRVDVAFATLYYPDDVIANLNVSWIDSNKERRVVVVGSERRVVFDDLDNLERLRVFEKGVSVEKRVTDFGEFQLLLRDGDIISPRIEPSEPLRNMCSHFLDCVRTRSRPDTDCASGLEVVTVMEAIEKSLSRKGSYVEIEW